MTSDAAMTPDDLGLLDRVAARVVELRMEVPALLTIETATPLSVIAAQAMVFFEPFVAALLRMSDYRRFAKLIERREALELLARRIEVLSDSAHRQRRADAAARRASRSTAPPGN